MARSRNDYTITIENPNLVPVTLSSITDTLPAGFSYITNLTSGVTTSNPIVSGRMLTWNGPFVVPAGGSVSLKLRGHRREHGWRLFNGGRPATDLAVVNQESNNVSVMLRRPCPCGATFSENFDRVTRPEPARGLDGGK